MYSSNYSSNYYKGCNWSHNNGSLPKHKMLHFKLHVKLSHILLENFKWNKHVSQRSKINITAMSHHAKQEKSMISSTSCLWPHNFYLQIHRTTLPEFMKDLKPSQIFNVEHPKPFEQNVNALSQCCTSHWCCLAIYVIRWEVTLNEEDWTVTSLMPYVMPYFKWFTKLQPNKTSCMY